VDTAALIQELNSRYKQNPKTPVFITGDKSASYRAVGGVLQQVRSARFTRVSFVTKEAERNRN
jgi:biopolymer transport protein ExbD